MKFAIIPPGEFMMGCDLNSTITLKIPPGQFREGFARSITESTPRHLVRITRPFYMQMHEVTNGQYQKLIGKLPDFNDPEKPDMALMRGIAPQEATAFCDELSRKEGKTPAHRMVEGRPSRILDANGYRLPTEAEWEYSCRAGTTTIWFLGEDASIAGNLDLLRDYQSMHRGAAVKANPFSLFDQYGGSSEWCFDRFEPYGAKTVIDPFVDPGGVFLQLFLP